MNALWLAPLIVLAVGAGVVVVLAREAAVAARGLREGLGRFAELSAAVDEVRVESAVLRQALSRRGHK